jgi:L-arabinonolactonase
MARPEITCVFEAGAEVGEGALWDVLEQALFWVDIPKGRLHRFDPASGVNRTWEMGEPIGCLALRERGGAVVTLQSGFHLFDFATAAKTRLIDPEADRPHNRFNDGATDRQGRFWAGTMRTGEPAAEGAFYRLDPDHSCNRWQDGIHTTNGLAFSPDGRTMYCSDSNPQVRTIWACDYDPATGAPGERRVFFDTRAVAGRPDGGTVDADGCYWMAGVGGSQLVRLTPAGRIDRIVALPVERPTRPAFGGSDLDVLFVTSIGAGTTQPQAGGIFALTGLGVQGVPEVRFGG